MQILSKALVASLFCLALIGPASGQVFIHEILGDPNQDWDGDGALDFKGDEWVEVINMGGQSVDLSRYWLRDDFGSDGHLQLSGILESGQTQVIFGSDAVAWQTAHGLTTIGLSINNSGDAMELLQEIDDPNGPQMLMVHRVVLPDHAADDDRSLGWDPELENWALYDGLNLYNGSQEPLSTGCLPTPEMANECVPNVPIENTSWGKLKSHYR